MGTSSRLATMIDADMLARHGVSIAPPGTPDNSLVRKTGILVSWELGGRFLLRYLLSSQLASLVTSAFLNRPHYVTPTPFSAEETIAWLALPSPNQPRPYVVLLKPASIPTIWGPRWVHLGGGIEYVLPNGFQQSDMVDVGTAPGTSWPLLVT